MLRDLLGTPGVEPLDEVPWSLLLDLWPERVPGFAEAALVAVAKGGRHEAVATFDRGPTGTAERSRAHSRASASRVVSRTARRAGTRAAASVESGGKTRT